MKHTDWTVVLRRVLAFGIDAIVVTAAVRPIASRVARSRGRRLLATVVLAGAAGFPYHVLLEGTFGRTVGKAVSGIAVVMEAGGPPTYAAAATRTALRLVDWLPVGYLLGLAAIAATGRDQRIGDLVAGTVVVGTGGPKRASQHRDAERGPRGATAAAAPSAPVGTDDGEREPDRRNESDG